MVMSMTGFGRDKQTVGNYDVTVEIRSVNHRYFEFSSRLPRFYTFLEERLKTFCREKITRGKVEVSVLIEDRSEDAVELELNRQYADAYIKALRSLAQEYHLKDDISVSSVIGNQDIFNVRRKETDEQAVSEAVMTVAEAALCRFSEMRSTEGKRLADDVESRAGQILELVGFIEKRSPQTVAEYRAALEQKMKELLGDTTVDEQRLLTETAIFADRIAVDEETVRLRSHINQLCGQLKTGGAIGRKLDFLIQEMNREANTIGSKAQNLEIAQTVVEIKAQIEKIREQIQNIE